MVARNINYSIQNCKTEKQSQDSLCRKPKLVLDLVQMSNECYLHKDSKDASYSEFFFQSSVIFSLSFQVRLFSLFFLCTSLPFTFFLVLLQDTKLELKICLLLQRPLFLFPLTPKILTYKIKVHITSCCVHKSWTTRDIQMKSELQCMMTSTYPNRPQTRPRPSEHDDRTRD